MDGPVRCQVCEPSVLDRGFFGRFIGPRRPDPGRFGLSANAGQRGLSAQGVEPDGRGSRPGSGHWESVE